MCRYCTKVGGTESRQIQIWFCLILSKWGASLAISEFHLTLSPGTTVRPDSLTHRFNRTILIRSSKCASTGRRAGEPAS